LPIRLLFFFLIANQASYHTKMSQKHDSYTCPLLIRLLVKQKPWAVLFSFSPKHSQSGSIISHKRSVLWQNRLLFISYLPFKALRSLSTVRPMGSSTASRWLRPEVSSYPPSIFLQRLDRTFSVTRFELISSFYN